MPRYPGACCTMHVNTMARPKLIEDWQVSRVAALIACGADINAHAADLGVKPSTLRKRIRALHGGMPLRIPRPACEGTLLAAARLIEAVNVETDSDALRRMADACREAAADAATQWEYIRKVGFGELPPPFASDGENG